MNWRVFFRFARWLLAIAALAYAYHLGSKASGASVSDSTSAFNSAYGLLQGLGLVVIGVALLAPEAIALLSIPFQKVVNGIFFPGEMGTPPPDYNLSRTYKEQGRFEEAIAHYHSILENHPQELLAYIEGVEAAHLNGTPEEAQRFYQLALRKLEGEVAQEQVRKALENPPVVSEEEELEVEATLATDLPPWRQGEMAAPSPSTGEEEDDLPPWRRAEITATEATTAATAEEDDLPPWLRETPPPPEDENPPRPS